MSTRGPLLSGESDLGLDESGQGRDGTEMADIEVFSLQLDRELCFDERHELDCEQRVHKTKLKEVVLISGQIGDGFGKVGPYPHFHFHRRYHPGYA
jgi:hypothetical protein